MTTNRAILYQRMKKDISKLLIAQIYCQSVRKKKSIAVSNPSLDNTYKNLNSNKTLFAI